MASPSRLMFQVAPAAALVGCVLGSSARIPVPAGPPDRGVAHDLTVAILPFQDGRLDTEASDPRRRYVYSGVEYRGTRLEDLEHPMGQVTEAFARNLLHTGIFARLVRVESREQAVQADLLLTGRLLRARGYVENEPPEGQVPRVLAEVAVEDLRLEDPATNALYFDGGTGWSIVERRPEAEPWNLLGEALKVAVERLAVIWREAAFEMPLRDRVSLSGPLTTQTPSAWSLSAPPGWRFTQGGGDRPDGWEGDMDCPRMAFTQRDALQFHRVLGPYVPEVRVWRCPSDVRLRWNAQADYPARILGRDGEGRWWFAWSVGASNWPQPEPEIFDALDLSSPPERYIFELPLGQAKEPSLPMLPDSSGPLL